MSCDWIPAAENVSVLPLTEKPFERLSPLSRVQFLATRDLPAAQRRLQVAGFVETFRWSSVQAHLPLQLPTPGDVPPWPGRLCRPGRVGCAARTTVPCRRKKPWICKG